MVKKLITFTKRLIEMVEEIQQVKGYVSFSAVVHAAVIELHAKTFPNYLKPVTKDEEPSARVRRKQMEKEAKADLVRDEQLAIGAELGGQVIMEGGREVCVYYTYTGKKRFEQKVPLNLLSTDLVKTQYQPSRERVEQLQKEGKTDY